MGTTVGTNLLEITNVCDMLGDFFFETNAELGLFLVISTFCDTSVPQNAKITRKHPGSANAFDRVYGVLPNVAAISEVLRKKMASTFHQAVVESLRFKNWSDGRWQQPFCGPNSSHGIKGPTSVPSTCWVSLQLKYTLYNGNKYMT